MKERIIPGGLRDNRCIKTFVVGQFAGRRLIYQQYPVEHAVLAHQISGGVTSGILLFAARSSQAAAGAATLPLPTATRPPAT
jgi:hypothetical protein